MKILKFIGIQLLKIIGITLALCFVSTLCERGFFTDWQINLTVSSIVCPLLELSHRYVSERKRKIANRILTVTFFIAAITFSFVCCSGNGVWFCAFGWIN